MFGKKKERYDLTWPFFVDVTEGSRFYENIFVSGGALLADDNILKTIELGKDKANLHVIASGVLPVYKFQ